MKKLIIGIMLLYGCSSTKVTIPVKEVVVIEYKEKIGGRPVYNVQVGENLYYMYVEEIANALKTGNWEYNEDL